ncbi:DUF2732 family protein [Erwinia pyri]|uniref:DUF2732 family protein n=1 Tax=Erwinia pyri TaxID=3062598 RepID=A0AA50DL16_9GAMM|nr:DUF2732 family protein [Erwinia sp. DE2]WLS78823.1 DUF2732 family protein [Erwinia sp. DE2]
MRNLEKRMMEANNEIAMIHLLTKANGEGKKAKALAVSIRLNAVAIHIQKNQLSGVQAAELLLKEAARYEVEAAELH